MHTKTKKYKRFEIIKFFNYFNLKSSINLGANAITIITC